MRSVRLPQLLTARLYHENIVDHYESPRNVGSLDKKDPSVGTGLVGAPACGDVMKLQMRVGADGTIEEAVFKVIACLAEANIAPRCSAANGISCRLRPVVQTFGCGSAIASSSYTTEWLKGKIGRASCRERV